MLDEDERLDTLAILTRNRAEIDRALQGLPIIIETPGQIRRKDELERRLQEIEVGGWGLICLGMIKTTSYILQTARQMTATATQLGATTQTLQRVVQALAH